MAKTKHVVVGALATAGVVGLGHTAAEAQSCATPEQTFTFEYGPTSAAGIVPGGQIGPVVNSLGAPYATFPSADKTVYRWGHGVTVKNPDGTGSIQRDELLVTANASGVITSVSYKPKCAVCGSFAIVEDACP
jgi:hypothetical protein